MSLSVNSNIQALNAYRNLNKTQSAMSNSLEKLSSGLRINRAADDAAGLAISENLKAQIGGIQQASKNAQDGVSLVQTADGALGTVHTLLQRLRTLAVQASNGSQSDSSRSAINAEAIALKAELTRISQTSNFNGINLIDGTFASGARFQIGYRGNDVANGIDGNVITVSLGSGATAGASTTASLAGASVTAATAAAFDFSSSALTVNVTVDGVAKALTVNGNYSSGGSMAANAGLLAAALNSQLNTAFGAPVASFAAGANGAITMTAATSGDHTLQVTGLTGGTTGGAGVGLTTGYGIGHKSITAGSFDVGGLGLADVWLAGQTSAQSAIGLVDAAISTVSTARANLGALQNRFQYTVDNLDTTAENLSSAQSRILDTDMAAQMVAFTRAQILSQAGSAMLAQAKNLPSSLLELLKS